MQQQTSARPDFFGLFTVRTDLDAHNLVAERGRADIQNRSK